MKNILRIHLKSFNNIDDKLTLEEEIAKLINKKYGLKEFEKFGGTHYEIRYKLEFDEEIEREDVTETVKTILYNSLEVKDYEIIWV